MILIWYNYPILRNSAGVSYIIVNPEFLNYSRPLSNFDFTILVLILITFKLLTKKTEYIRTIAIKQDVPVLLHLSAHA